jgi:hypothetical protein
MAEAEGKKEKDKDFLVQCSQHLPSESEAAEVPAHWLWKKKKKR